MTPQQLKDYAIRMEGLCDGLRQGSDLTLKWIAEQLDRDAAKPPVDAGTPEGSKPESD